MKLWGIHNDTLTTELVDEGFVSIGWDDLGDLAQPGRDRAGIKELLAENRPDKKPGAIAGWAGIILRFRDEIQAGDVVVAPYKPDSTINIGVVVGDYYFDAAQATHRHRRRIEWRKIGLSRTLFSQSALYEVGSFLTVFRVRRHTAEFLAALEAPEGLQPSSAAPAPVVEAVQDVVDAEDPDDSPDEPRASRIERHTKDFVLDALHRQISHHDFEEFTADLLRALGYQARVTQYSQDGGIDVIAHRDPLGVEPPQIKIQCKHLTGTIGAPEVQKLAGTLGLNELGLFVTLGTYTRDAQSIERQRPGLRLLTGEDVVNLVLEHYDQLPQKWRSIIPLTSVLVVSDTAE